MNDPRIPDPVELEFTCRTKDCDALVHDEGDRCAECSQDFADHCADLMEKEGREERES